MNLVCYGPAPGCVVGTLAIVATAHLKLIEGVEQVKLYKDDSGTIEKDEGRSRLMLPHVHG